MKLLRVLLGILVLSAVGYGVYKSSTLMSYIPTTKYVVEKQQDIMNRTQSGLQNLTNKAQSGLQVVTSGAQGLIHSGEALLQEKQQAILDSATKYAQEQKELLKKQAQQAAEDAAKKKIQGAFSGR